MCRREGVIDDRFNRRVITYGFYKFDEVCNLRTVYFKRINREFVSRVDIVGGGRVNVVLFEFAV